MVCAFVSSLCHFLGSIVVRSYTYLEYFSGGISCVLGLLLTVFLQEPQLSNCSFIDRSRLTDTKQMDLWKSCYIKVL